MKNGKQEQIFYKLYWEFVQSPFERLRDWKNGVEKYFIDIFSFRLN